MEERIRTLRRRGLKAYAIAREVGVEVGVVTATLRRFEREYRRQAEADARAEAAVYRREMIDRLEGLKREAWEQVELAKDQKKKTHQEMLKDADGKVTHQRAKVETLPGETSPSLISEIRQIELALGRLRGVDVEEPAVPLVPSVGRDLIVITPSQPLDLDRLRRLNEAVRLRSNGGNGGAVDVPAVVVGGNGDGGAA
jgi:hypothetical protein